MEREGGQHTVGFKADKLPVCILIISIASGSVIIAIGAVSGGKEKREALLSCGAHDPSSSAEWLQEEVSVLRRIARTQPGRVDSFNITATNGTLSTTYAIYACMMTGSQRTARGYQKFIQHVLSYNPILNLQTFLTEVCELVPHQDNRSIQQNSPGY